MNQIVASFLDAHVKEYEIQSLPMERAFEHFINRLLVNKYTVERFDPADIMMESGEIGLDGIAIIVNRILITDIDELENILSFSDVPNVRFVFIQSKTSENFDGSEIGTFCFGVKCFFESKENRPKTNEKIERLIEIKDRIYSKSINFQEAPILDLYFVTCGKWNDNTNLSDRINIEKKYFSDTGNFRDVNFYPYDNNKIIVSYKELKKKISKKINIERRFSLPPMKGITQAYSGIIKCLDFIELLKDSEGEMLNNIFEDNVRDFQGYNLINNEIKDTIRNSEQEYFAVLNNGITIICKKMDVTGDAINIFDYQIVNGCQTSNILFENKDFIKDNSYILAKIIEAKNENLLDRIIYTTNRQTEIKSEAFASTKPFHKGLEDYYNSIPPLYRLYYERRSKQYDRQDDVNKNKIITLPVQVYAYIATFLNEPHSTHRYYGEVLDAYKSRLFGEGSLYEPYFISAYFIYYINDALRSGKIPRKKYSKYKYHLACLMKAIFVGKDINISNKKKLKQQCVQLMEAIKNEKEIESLLDTSISCLDQSFVRVQGIQPENLHRSRELTQSALDVATDYAKSKNSSEYLKAGDIVSCVIKSIKRSFVIVELKSDDERKNGSIHISKIAKKYIEKIADEVEVGKIVQAKILDRDYYESKYGWELSMIF